jgi:hypothetical protein
MIYTMTHTISPQHVHYRAQLVLSAVLGDTLGFAHRQRLYVSTKNRGVTDLQSEIEKGSF